MKHTAGVGFAGGFPGRLPVLAAILALAVVAGPKAGTADVCNSPFLKYLQRPERIMYVWCVDAHGKNNDFMAVVDVDPNSKDYGKIVKTIDLGSKNNEPHHFGFTDDRRYIYGATLFTSKLYFFDVGTNPDSPKLVKVVDFKQETGLTSPHSIYALAGRVMIPSLGNAQGDLPAGIAEYTNDGSYIRTIMNPATSPYGYDVGVKPEIDRLVSSGFTPLVNFSKPFPQMDKNHFGDQLILWDFSKMQPIATAKTAKSPLEIRWARQPGHNYGFTNCLLGDSIWLFRPTTDGKLEAKEAVKTEPLPADLRQSVDDKYLYVTSFGAGDVEQFDISDPDHLTLHSKVHIGAHPNMMNISTDGRRMFVTNSLLSTADYGPDDFWMKLVRIDDNGMMQVDPKFDVDFTKLPGGPGRPHDMLEN